MSKLDSYSSRSHLYWPSLETHHIPQRIIQNIILSMRRRCVACITTRGGHTKYWILKSRVSVFQPLSDVPKKVAPVVGLTGRLSTRLPNASQTCSIGVISGDSDGQCIQLTFCACKKFIETLAVCERTLSCWAWKCVAVVLPVSPQEMDIQSTEFWNRGYLCFNHKVTSQKRNCVSNLFSSVRVFIVVIVWRIYICCQTTH
jgi:hypothetical protein